MSAQAQSVELEAFRVVGLHLPQAGAQPAYIPTLWVALAARLHEVAEPIAPRVLYGIWHKPEAADTPGYLVGVRVAGSAPLPEGMAALEVPAGRYVMAEHRGHLGSVGETYDAIMRWMRENAASHRPGPTFEVYDTTQAIDESYRVPIYEPIV